MDIISNIEIILAAETSDPADWNLVETLSDETVAWIIQNNAFSDIDHELYKFLEDYDIRRIDYKYEQSQISHIKRLLAD